ncbi:MAG: hypothetical protein E6K79_03895 [Candidatus Eisenbacteria bacterium]|uniref:Type 4a pilus biogenesis protein PilO n=1 Tax=Eiseniibacteriota bacterium TaxID=2212470 RepID=A0A538TQX5_UNCEI|nr:MAG: hypothetical protein E6K79_03895 [Candidatus Eisenbacteria bacterium]
MAIRLKRQPLIGHGLIVVALLGSIGVARAVYVEPRLRELKALESDRIRIATQLTDLQRGIQEMETWAREHPGEDFLTFRSRHALPAGEMVSSFLRSLAEIAKRHNVRTELIQPAGTPLDEVVADASGIPVTYRKAELRFRLWASYRDLGEYLKEIESMDQLVVVRSVGVQYEAANYPDLVSDVAIWLYGTP